jgi:hypothetical protein
MRNIVTCAAFAAAFGLAGTAQADFTHNYEDLSEGFLGATFNHNGVTYRDVNNVAGAYPDGNTFAAGDNGDQVIIENATLFYGDFPTYGSPNNAMTFGSAFINGDNLSIGALASVWMDLDELGQSASLDIAFYENGPWGTVEFHLDALLDGVVVGSDVYTLDGPPYDPNHGRDNPNFTSMTVNAAAFDSLHLYGWQNGQFSAPRGMIDNLHVQLAPVPEPGTMAVLGLGALALLRRRAVRKSPR